MNKKQIEKSIKKTISRKKCTKENLLKILSGKYPRAKVLISLFQLQQKNLITLSKQNILKNNRKEQLRYWFLSKFHDIVFSLLNKIKNKLQQYELETTKKTVSKRDLLKKAPSDTPLWISQDFVVESEDGEKHLIPMNSIIHKISEKGE